MEPNLMVLTQEIQRLESEVFEITDYIDSVDMLVVDGCSSSSTFTTCSTNATSTSSICE